VIFFEDLCSPLLGYSPLVWKSYPTALVDYHWKGYCDLQ